MRYLISLLATLAEFLAAAADLTAGDLVISDAYAFETPPHVPTAAAYVSMTNTGDAPDALLGIEAATAKAMLHASETAADGVVRMMQVEELVLQPGESVVLEPGAMHVMLTDLDSPLAAGDTLEATLVFREAGRVAVTFDIVGRGGGHEGHDDH